MSLSPYQSQRIRLAISAFSGLNDQITGGQPQFPLATDIQFEIGAFSNNLPIDGGLINSISLALKPSNNIDATPILSATVAPGSAGWNSNFANAAGNNVIPIYASYPFNGSGAVITATYVNPATLTFVINNGGNGYTSGVSAILVGGGGSGTVTLTLTGGVVTGISGTFAGYTSAPSVFVIPQAATYTIGVQAGATYSWTAGNDDLTLSNGSSLVGGSNLVPATAAFSASSYTLSGLTANTDYYYILGNATGISGTITINSGATFFRTGSTTSVTVAGPTSALVTTEVYQASVGSNILSGAASYVASSSSSGSNLAISANLSSTSYSAAVAGQTYGTVTLNNLTVGNTYVYSLGNNEPSSIGGAVAGQTSASGTFTALTTSVQIFGIPLATVTATVYASAAGTYIQNGLTPGSTYFWTKSGSNDTSVTVGATTLNASGFFVATTSQVTLNGVGGALITALLQNVSAVATGSFTASSDTVTFTGVPGTPVTAQLTGNVGWNSYTDQTCVIPFTNIQTNIAPAIYWLLVTATTTNGRKLDLGAGYINVADQGENTPIVVPGNLVPSGANYDGSGNYTLSGLIQGTPYSWVQGADDISCGSLASSGIFIASGTMQILTGTPSTSVTAVVVRLSVSNPVAGNIPVVSGSTGIQTANGLTIPFVPTNIEVWLMAGINDGYIPVFPVFGTWNQTSFQYNIVGIIPNSNYVLGWRAS